MQPRAAVRLRPTCAAASNTRRIWLACSSRGGCVRPSRVWGCRHEGQCEGQWGLLRAGRRAAHAARVLLARRLRVDRHPRRLRHLELRLLRGRDGWRPGGEVVHDVRGAGRWPRDPHGGGPCGRRQAPPAPAGLLGSAWTAVRLLHAWHAADLVRAAQDTTPIPARPRFARDSPGTCAGAPDTRTS